MGLLLSMQFEKTLRFNIGRVRERSQWPSWIVKRIIGWKRGHTIMRVKIRNDWLGLRTAVLEVRKYQDQRHTHHDFEHYVRQPTDICMFRAIDWMVAMRAFIVFCAY